MMPGCHRAKTPRTHGAGDLLQTALELGDRQADELVRLARLSSRYRATLYCALHHARCGRVARVIAILERELARDRASP
jgi:hypothetical protein